MLALFVVWRRLRSQGVSGYSMSIAPEQVVEDVGRMSSALDMIGFATWGSRFGVDDDVGHVRLRFTNVVLEPASEFVRVG